MITDLTWMSAAEVSALYRRRELSPVEYVSHLIDRIIRFDSLYASFVHFDPDQALADARRVEHDMMRKGVSGPLHGIPYGLKDIIDYAGVPTTANSRILRDHVPERNAGVVDTLASAGAIFLGKLTSHEFAVGGPSFDLPWPPARNPWNPEYFTGGSSSGCGAAVAAGFLPLAIGTDTGGSIRAPASFCGVTGMKPTAGTMDLTGVIPLAYSLDQVGIITRTVGDNASTHGALARAAPDHGHTQSGPMASRSHAMEDGLRDLRVGVITHFHTEDMTADPAVAAALEEVIDVLERLGCRAEEIRTPSLHDFAACQRVIVFTEAFSVHAPWLRDRPADYGRIARERLLTGAFFSGADYVDAIRTRGRLCDALRIAMEPVDIVVSANSMDPPALIRDEESLARTFPRQARTPFSVTGYPAMSVPAGFTDAGLPIGVQFAGKAYDDALVYHVGSMYEDATQWTQEHPELDLGVSHPKLNEAHLTLGDGALDEEVGHPEG